METPKIIENLSARYEKNPVIRGLIQLIPFGIGSAVDTAVAVNLTKIREERSRSFFDELARGGINLSEEQISNENFLHAFFSTTKAVLNTRRREKIKLFGKLFATFCKNSDFEDLELLDEFEEILAILDDLSYQEYLILLILQQNENSVPPDHSSKHILARTDVYWENFLEEVERKLRIPRNDIPGILARLNRTGHYKTITGTILNYKGDRGHLTTNFKSFMKFLGEQ